MLVYLCTSDILFTLQKKFSYAAQTSHAWLFGILEFYSCVLNYLGIEFFKLNCLIFSKRCCLKGFNILKFKNNSIFNIIE